MTEEKDAKTNRILTIYEKLTKDEVIYKKQLATQFGVNEKTIQRDIEDIRAYLYNSTESNGIDVEYIRDKKGYILKKREDINLTKEDVLAISKILLESRAFCKEEINDLINKLLNGLGYEQRKHAKELIGNELLHFTPLRHNKKLLSKIWALSEFIRCEETIEISYIKTNGTKVKRTINPVSIIFSEYYFYLIAYFTKSSFDDPTVFRIDRIEEYKRKGEQFHMSYAERFQDGEFRKRGCRTKLEFYNILC